MATAPPAVPVTVFAGIQSTWYPQFAIGGIYYQPQTAIPDNSYWMALVDLTTLNVVWQGNWTNNAQFPTPIASYLGKPNFLLLLMSNALRIDNLPQGSFYQTLTQIGSGPLLDQAEQINTQMSTGTIGQVSYILATTMVTNDLPGFEKVSYTNFQVLTFQLVPTVINGQTVYLPASPE